MKPESKDDHEDHETSHIDVPLGAALRRARRAFPLSRELMADSLSVSVSTIQRYENGEQRIPAARLWQMCRRMNVEVCQLFAGLPHHLADLKGVEEPKTVFDHEDRRAKALDSISRALGDLDLGRLEIAVEVVKALKARHT